MRALVLAVGAGDYGTPTWKATLDRVGAAYDVLDTEAAPLSTETLVRPDGVGRYNAILLTNSMMMSDTGAAGLSDEEWNLLWAYERDYGVRQATLYSSYGTWPESYCLDPGSEGGVADAPLSASLTETGAAIFDYLKPTATVPIVQSYVYRDRLTPSCNGQPVLTAGDDVLGVLSTSIDGRERLALTFTSNENLMQANLLAYGLFRWASRGLFLGEQRHFLNIDVDDWFNTSDHFFPDGHIESDPGFQLSAHDAYNASLKQTALRSAYPLAGDFTMNLAYNAGDANMAATSTCAPDGAADQLTATSRCLANQFRWLNHTLTHRELDNTDYPTSLSEMAVNLGYGGVLGLPTPADILKTPGYSGLGVYNPDPNDQVGPPTDYGIAASNVNMLNAARDLGIRYLHGNMSFASQVPSCFNCGIVHPLEPSITVVPDWPTNVAYHTTTPDEETAFYNSFYGPTGRFPYWPQNLTYDQILDYEADVALGHLATGSIYTHTFHIANLYDYGNGSTLVTDWLDRVLAKYSAYYAVPVLNPDWSKLAEYVTSRNNHFAALSAGVEAVYDRVANTVTVTSSTAQTVTVSGVQAGGSTSYGSDVSAPVSVTAGGPATFTPVLRP